MNTDEKQQELNRQDAKSKDRHWWLKMLVASAALAALLFGAYFLTPVVQVRYRVWHYHSGRDRDGKSLKWLADFAVERRMEKAAIVRMMGEDLRDKPDYLMYRINPCPLSSMPIIGYFILLKDGRALEVQVWPGAGIPIGG